MINLGGNIGPGGDVVIHHLPKLKYPLPITKVLRQGLPQRNANPAINKWRKSNFFNLMRGAVRIYAAEKLGIAHMRGLLYLEVIRPQENVSDLIEQYCQEYIPGMNFPAWAAQFGIKFDRAYLGLASTRVVTTAGAGFIVDAWQNSVELEIMKYHGIGTDNTAENVADTALGAELTTEYNPNSTRATGTLTEGGSGNIFETVGTNTVDATVAIVEHGILSQAATGGGVLVDRSVFAAVNMVSADSLASTYDFTITAGS